ncbi:hypothetical protein NE626_15365, partial [Intestinimonas massiliensis]|nr:hypothetical protein [Intestinimonas massiliensis (ex Afouda et al. 2020)]
DHRRPGDGPPEGLQRRHPDRRGRRYRDGDGAHGSNVLKYKLADGTDLVVRPSGTEPKVKVYILAQGASKAVCDATVAKYAAWAETLKR